MSSLGIFDKETKTYKKVADLSKPAVIDSAMSDSSTNAVQNKVVKSYVDTRTTVDSGMSDTSTNPVQNKAVKSYVDGRTVLDTAMSETSTKAVQNKVVKSYVDTRTTFDSAMSDTSNNAVQNKVVKSYVDTRTTLDTSMSDSSTNAVQNKVVKSYADDTFRKKSLAFMAGDSITSYCQLCTIKIYEQWISSPIEITVQERIRGTLDRLTVLFQHEGNIDPSLASFKVFGEFDGWYISKRATSTWVIYGAKAGLSASISVVDYSGIDGVDVTWDVTGVTALPDSKTKAVWGGIVGHAVSADSANSASTASKLATPRNIALTGAVTGNANFDGSGNVSIATSVNHTHNYAGSSSAGGAANLLYLPRVIKNANYQPGPARIEAAEFDNRSSNLPDNNWFHIITGQGADENYNSQLALGMTGERMYYRNRDGGSWTSWKKIAYTSDPVAWDSITGKPSTYTPSSHTHTKSQITDFPSSLPANGGNSSTVNGHTVNSDVPSGAKFTDTTYNDATTSAHGLMTPAMVSKLNGIADGANRTTVDTSMSSTSTNPVQNKIIKSYVDGQTGYHVGSNPPENTNLLWIDSLHGGMINYFASDTSKWHPVRAKGYDTPVDLINEGYWQYSLGPGITIGAISATYDINTDKVTIIVNDLKVAPDAIIGPNQMVNIHMPMYNLGYTGAIDAVSTGGSHFNLEMYLQYPYGYIQLDGGEPYGINNPIFSYIKFETRLNYPKYNY